MTANRRTVAAWMSEEPVVIEAGCTVGDAFALMIELGYRRLPVVDGAGDLVGIVTRSDILQSVPTLASALDAGEAAAQPLAEMAVEHLMSADPITVTPDDPIQRAADRMREYQISGLPVVEGDRVVGILTESDIFRLVAGT